MKSTHLLRVEGANLDRFVYDTRDLSTMRGASLLLLDATRSRCRQWLVDTGAQHIVEVSSGASIGLFGFCPPEGRTADWVRDEVARRLRESRDFQHATFLVDVAPRAEYIPSLEAVLASNRHRQYRAATVAIPAHNPDLREQGICDKDALRPGCRHNGLQLSDSTRVRRSFGLEQKQRFYEDWSRAEGEEPLEFPGRFANDFEEIATPSNIGLDDRRSREPTANKLAVFYADGNRFRDIGRAVCTTMERHQAWDRYLRSSRKAWLRNFLSAEMLWPGSTRWCGGDPPEAWYRFETLLWGGDELMFVMPARNGWRFAQHFFAAAEDWAVPAELRADGKFTPDRDARLTHTAALVFCHHSAPIHRIQALAKAEMAESAKGLTGPDKDGGEWNFGRRRNQLVYQVLESFDHLGTSYGAAVAQRFPGKSVAAADLVLAEDAEGGVRLSQRLERLSTGFASLRDMDFPRSQLRALVLEIATEGENCRFDDIKASFQQGAQGERIGNALAEMRDCCDSDAAFWVHLEELWDYAQA